MRRLTHERAREALWRDQRAVLPRVKHDRRVVLPMTRERGDAEALVQHLDHVLHARLLVGKEVVVGEHGNLRAAVLPSYI